MKDESKPAVRRTPVEVAVYHWRQETAKRLAEYRRHLAEAIAVLEQRDADRGEA